MRCKAKRQNHRHSADCMSACCAGAFGQSAYQSASALFDTLTSFISGAPRSLKELRVVLYDRKMIPQFVSAVEEMGKKQNRNRPTGVLNWFRTSMFEFTSCNKRQNEK